jgi:hypothetical protein
MGYAIETVAGSYTAAAATGVQAYTAVTGQSFQVRALAPNANAWLETLWTHSSATGYTRIRSPRMHDDVVGLQFAHYTNNMSPLGMECLSQELFSQDILIVEDNWRVAPAAVAQQIAFNLYYDDIAGINANFWTWAQVQTAARAAPVPNQYLGVQVNPISGGAITAWGAGVALNSVQDVMKANSYYAVIGYETNVAFTALSLIGTDLGNLQVGGPGSVDPVITRQWFPLQEVTTGRPSIPVINSQNKVSTLVQVIDTTLTTTFDVSLILLYLGPTGA